MSEQNNRKALLARATHLSAYGFAGRAIDTVKPIEVTDELLAALKAEARAAQELSYAPYSGYHVGAAVLTIGGRTFAGCGNQENSNFTLTIHGEQTAILAATTAGAMKTEGDKFLAAVYLTTAILEDQRYECLPCGGCRQFVSEWSAAGGQWIIEQIDGTVKYYSFDEFLPFPYA